jgi:hypothetical protein
MPGRGLQLPEQLPFERWLRVGRQLAGIHSSSAWYLGDWLVYGETAFSERYRKAIEQTSLDYQTLRNYAWVARRFSLSRRRDSLSFGHHAEVAALPEAEQDFWLRKADELNWSVKHLRQQVRVSLSERSARDGKQSDHSLGRSHADEPAPTDCSSVRLEFHITPWQLETYQDVATKGGYTLEEWAVSILDQAVRPGM